MKKAVAILLFLALITCAFSGCVGEKAVTPTPTPMPTPVPTPTQTSTPTPTSTPVKRVEATPTITPVPTPVPPPVPTPAIAPLPRPTPQPPLNIEAKPSQPYYLPGEPVEIEFSFTNTILESITLSPFPPEIQVTSPRTHEIVRSFVPGAQELELGPGKVMSHTLAWDQREDSGEQVSTGWYYIDAKNITVTKANPPQKTGLDFGTIAKVLIQFPQGAMNKTIDVNQSQTLNDITITLEWVELSAMGVSFYAFTIPPSYSPTQPQGPPIPTPPPYMVPVHAQYDVDGFTKDAGYSGIGIHENGIKLTWGHYEGHLDPVPSDAKKLTFIITSFGDMEGPWEFKVPLE
ncbi:MAG: hypothetical protein PHD13_05900 [Methanocellales archaeon]|nr:hypothetical protein [Methanocellales archaeon]MDD3292028.1 hypothetical protein [Methanocellales archaeon]MDD5235689.1 hypothetical protein [Methanocellales archaeon]MDD5485615.1 hypothetical protein [Methanocellales archaeon]